MKSKKYLLFILILLFSGSLLAMPLGKQIMFHQGDLYWRVKSIENAVVTGYCPCKICCGKKACGKTSTGKNAAICDGVAVDPKLIPYGSLLYIPGAGYKVADDTGGAMRQDNARGICHIDVRFSSHQLARQWGVKNLPTSIYKKIGWNSKPKSAAIHTVKPGDSLSKIARLHNTKVAALMRLNKIKDPGKIQAGQKLKLR